MDHFEKCIKANGYIAGGLYGTKTTTKYHTENNEHSISLKTSLTSAALTFRHFWHHCVTKCQDVEKLVSQRVSTSNGRQQLRVVKLKAGLKIRIVREIHFRCTLEHKKTQACK